MVVGGGGYLILFTVTPLASLVELLGAGERGDVAHRRWVVWSATAYDDEVGAERTRLPCRRNAVARFTQHVGWTNQDAASALSCGNAWRLISMLECRTEYWI